ncbi:hypothetical protein CI109_107221 [Kwoniella shandongensis]|uniref:Uncharacterized protein n=1 Tax=Kwoniella shandongensis TaxID=1734106 RepID=A0A5M6C2E3_9TREE|nr:uncharacterized protein CI109_002504 [Kwoniella shandongensis]KAA5529163.1 hypothetical protein CI109_002504 [Kwoniella shandongensis]
MFFSIKTIALIASTGLIGSTSAAVIEERGNSLCNQRNYGAQGYPWQSYSTPGSFCSPQKPSNNKYWKQIPFWDGGDNVRCSGKNKNNYQVCKGGNKHTKLPKGCNPPHRKGGKGGKGKTTTAAPAATSQAAPAASSAAASSASAVSSAAAVPSADAASSDAASSVADASTVTSAAPAASSAAAIDPLDDPVCELNYQVTYQNYTMVAPNGVWAGLTVGSATQDASYMTYTLATSVDDCLRACDQIEGCVFVNSYFDRNDEEAYLPKHTPGLITCAMFSTCVGTEKNDNFGGQDDPNTIENSTGYCKSSACVAA